MTDRRAAVFAQVSGLPAADKRGVCPGLRTSHCWRPPLPSPPPPRSLIVQVGHERDKKHNCDKINKPLAGVSGHAPVFKPLGVEEEEALFIFLFF